MPVSLHNNQKGIGRTEARALMESPDLSIGHPARSLLFLFSRPLFHLCCSFEQHEGRHDVSLSCPVGKLADTQHTSLIR